MKRLINIGTLILLVTTLFSGCSKNNKQDDENSSSAAYGIVAEVTEVGDGYCIAKVTDEDEIFSVDSIVVIYFDSVYRELNEAAEDAGDVKRTEKVEKVNVGDIISVTYTEFKKENDENSITAPYVEIVK